MLQIEIRLHPGDKGVVAPSSVRMAEHTGLLVQEKDVLVLVQHVQLRSRDPEIGVVFIRLLEKFVVDVHLYDVVLAEFPVTGKAFPVDFDPFQADVFLQKGRRKQRHGLADEAVEPLSGVVCSDCEFLHDRILGFLDNGHYKPEKIV